MSDVIDKPNTLTLVKNAEREENTTTVKPFEAKIPQNDGKVGYKKPPVATQFKPGVTLNPGGKPAKSRNKLQGDFLREMAADFDKEGKKAIVRMREERPADYIKCIASLMPRELEVSHSPLDELSDEALQAAIETVQAMLAAKGEISTV